MRPESYMKLWYFNNSFRSAVKTLLPFLVHILTCVKICKIFGKKSLIQWKFTEILILKFYSIKSSLFCDQHSHMTHHKNHKCLIEFRNRTSLEIGACKEVRDAFVLLPIIWINKWSVVINVENGNMLIVWE